MTFADLYGEALNHELGSSDNANLFTTVRRKVAINRAQKEFARLTKLSVPRELTIPIVSGTSTYNLDTLTSSRFVQFSRTSPRLAVTTIATGAVKSTEVIVRSSAWLDESEAGWRDTANTGTPSWVADDPKNGANFLTLTPIPTIPASETWALVVPYQGNTADMVADGDLPFDSRPSLEPYHWALAHFAAAILERLRKDPDAEKTQIAKFGAYIEDWNANRKPAGQHKRVLLQRDYLGEVSRARGGITVQDDPRR